MKKIVMGIVVIILAFAGYFAYTKFIAPPAKVLDPIAEVIIVGAHSNAAAPDFSNEAFRNEMETVYKSCGEVTVISVDGEAIASKTTIFGTDRKLPEKNLTQLAEKNTDELVDETLIKVRAKTPEADYVEALHVASGILESTECSEKRLTIMGSLLSTKGALSYVENPQLLDAGDANKIVKELQRARAIPNLNEVTVNVYASDTTAPQESLSYKQAEMLQTQFKAICREAGAKVNFHKSTNKGRVKNYTKLPKVTTVDIATDKVSFTGAVKFSDEELSFIADQAVFASEAEARTRLQPIAAYLQSDTQRHVLVAGTTASGTEEFCQNLSQERADAVKKILVDYGAEEKQITCMGLGFKNVFHVKDLNEKGELVEEKARQNRAVYIVDRYSEEGKALLKSSKMQR